MIGCVYRFTDHEIIVVYNSISGRNKAIYQRRPAFSELFLDSSVQY